MNLEREWHSELHRLRNALSEAFKEKKLYSVLDKKRVMREALGYAKKMCGIREEEIKAVLRYMEGKTAEELRSDVIAWVRNGVSSGITKSQVQNIVYDVPSDIELMPFAFEHEHIRSIGFVHGDYVHKLDAIKEAIRSKKETVLNDKKIVIISKG